MNTRKERQTSYEAAIAAIRKAIDDHCGGQKDPDFLRQRLIGQMLADARYSPNNLDCNAVDWSIDEYVAMTVGPLWPRLLKLHALLVASGATPDKPYDFESCDRYGVAFANEEKWKSMALCTQNYTYMVVLERHDGLSIVDGKPEGREAYRIHIRFCTPSLYSRDPSRADFKSLGFLSDASKVYPATGYGPTAHEYFRYKDMRDRGYLCSVEPDMLEDSQYATKDTLGNYKMLQYVIYDLDCHCSMASHAEREAAKAAQAANQSTHRSDQ